MFLLFFRDGFLYSDFPYSRKFSEKCQLTFKRDFDGQQVCRKCQEVPVDEDVLLDVLEEVVEEVVEAKLDLPKLESMWSF